MAIGKIKKGLKGLMDLLDEPVIDPSLVNRKYSNRTAAVLEDFYRPNIANDVRTFDQAPFKLSQLEGRGVMFPESDVTASGYDLVGIGNKPLARPVTMETGVDHIFYAPDKALWKNDASVANKYVKRAKARQEEVEKLGKETGGQDVFLLPYEGGPQSSDWWTGIGRTMINYNLENAPAKSVSLMDEFIKSKIPDWPGADSPNAEKIWNATGGGTRMEVTAALDKMRLEGGLTEGQARVATSRQDRLNIPHGSLQNVGVLDIDRGFTPNLSPDYNASLHGEGVGVLQEPVTAYDFLLDRTTASGKPLAPRSLQWQDTSKIVTEQDLRRMQDKGININSPASVGVLGAAAAAAALAPDEAEAGVLGATLKSARATADQFTNIARKQEQGIPLTPKEMMVGEKGATFLNPQKEATARVYDAFRKQVRGKKEPLFDTTGIDGAITIGGQKGARGLSRYTFPPEYQDVATEVGVATPDLIELSSNAKGAAVFRQKLLEGKDQSKYGASVEAYSQGDYEGLRLFISEDGSAGYALKPDGDIVSAFSTGENTGVAPHMIMHALEQGGTKLDAFDTVLPDLYAQLGFRESARLKFDPSQAPEDWEIATYQKFNQGQPDVSFMAQNQGNAIPVEPNMVEDYGTALDLQSKDVGLLGTVTGKKAQQAAPVAMTGILGAGMSDESDASLAKLAARGLELTDMIDPKDSRVGEYFLSEPDSTKSIGVLRTDSAVDSGFDDGYMASQLTEIDPEYRRQGLAGEMYAAAEELSGNKLVPSTTLSPDGAAMWNSRDRGLLEQVQQKMGSDNYATVEDVLNPDGMGPSVQLKGFDRKYAAPAAGLLAASEYAEPREYREAPVVEETSFGDMIQEYADINQRTEAAEDQKFDALMREDARLREMGSASFGKLSPELAAYRRSQILPGVGELGMGVLGGAVDSLDFLSQIPSSIASMRMPERTPLRDRLGGLLDYNFMDKRNQKAIDEARFIGGLLSPI
tara:strand:- start:2383 stop:5328 length:2946 start_codon:yes stop_codon:yes gene_type:complete